MSTLSKTLYGGLSAAVLLGFSVTSFAGDCGAGYTDASVPGKIICKSSTGGADKPIKTCLQCRSPSAVYNDLCLRDATGTYTGVSDRTNCGLKWSTAGYNDI
ncbi:MAG: hypothetical protein H0U70_02805 [Tatlockia sp.]|nr:hypothetical protein [Tatlockia sp.]